MICHPLPQPWNWSSMMLANHLHDIFDCRAKGCILVFRNSCRWTPKDEDVFSWMQDRSIVYTAHVLHKCNLLQESFQTSTERLRKERGLLLIWLGIMFHRFVDCVELWRTLTTSSRCLAVGGISIEDSEKSTPDGPCWANFSKLLSCLLLLLLLMLGEIVLFNDLTANGTHHFTYKPDSSTVHCLHESRKLFFLFRDDMSAPTLVALALCLTSANLRWCSRQLVIGFLGWSGWGDLKTMVFANWGGSHHTING